MFYARREELVVLLQHLGVRLEKEELDALLASLDLDGESEGEIDFEEFYVCKFGG
jgi:Ca2+-binding EF-hand superfamily protein